MKQDSPGAIGLLAKALTTYWSKPETEQRFFELENMPVSRIGDQSYLPLDIKADFRGAIQPWAQLPYFLQEADGSLAALRPGYNGEYNRVFYAYSLSGELTPSALRMTDSEYRPLWLAADEYVTGILDGSDKGFLAHIKSTTNLSLNRYFWVEHNGTLDARFHTYLDITATIALARTGCSSVAASGGCQYIPEISAFALLQHNTVNRYMLTLHPVAESFKTAYSSSTPAALSAKSLDWMDWSGQLAGNNSEALLFVADSEINLARYFKFINEPSARTSTSLIHSSAGRRQLIHAVKDGVVRFGITTFTYLAYVGASRSFGWFMTMDYAIAQNTLRRAPDVNDPQYFQSLPLVFDAQDYSSARNTLPVPSPITDSYKANKLPMQVGEGLPVMLGNMLNRIQFLSDTRMVGSSVGTSQTLYFYAASQDMAVYAGQTAAEKRFDVLSRFGIHRGIVYRGYPATDASILSKSLQYVSFLSPLILKGLSDSKLYGESLSTKAFKATLPDYGRSATVYSTDANQFLASLPIPSKVELSMGDTARRDITTVVHQTGAMHANISRLNDLRGSTGRILAASSGVDAVTGVAAVSIDVDASQLTTYWAQLDAHFKATASYQPASPLAPASLLSFLRYDSSTRQLYLLYTYCSMDSGKAQHDFAVIKLGLSADNLLQLPSIATDSIQARIAGPVINGNLVGVQPTPALSGLGVYLHSTGDMYFLCTCPLIIGVVGGNSSPIVAFKYNPSTNAISSRHVASLASWLTCGVGAHPFYGLYYTSTWVDSQAKCRMSFQDKTGVSALADRMYQSCEAWLAGAAISNTLILSSKSAAGFVLYTSDIPCLLNGIYGTLPTSTIDLASVVADPSNKTFYFYAESVAGKNKLTVALDALEETISRALIGKVVTNSTGIASSVFRKVTRIDQYRIDTEQEGLGSSIRTYQRQATLPAYIYATTAEANQAKATKTPPGFSTIFSQWDRTDGAAYYPKGVGATGDAAAWSLATNPDRVIQPNNTNNVCAFISDKSFQDFDFEATLFSSNADDDWNGLVAGFVRTAEGKNYTLCAVRNAGGIGHFNTLTTGANYDFAFVLVENALTSAPSIPEMPFKVVQATRSNTISGPGWGGAYTRVRVARTGNILRAKCSAWSASRDSVPLLDSSELVLDLTQIPLLAPFLGSSKYGYMTRSQAASTYFDSTFVGSGADGVDPNYIYDVETGQVFKYDFGSSQWKLQAGVTLQERLGYVREIYNPETGHRFMVTSNQVVQI